MDLHPDIVQFIADAQWAVCSEHGAKVACMEHRALRASWLKALVAAGLTEEQAQERGRGLWMLAAPNPTQILGDET